MSVGWRRKRIECGSVESVHCCQPHRGCWKRIEDPRGTAAIIVFISSSASLTQSSISSSSSHELLISSDSSSSTPSDACVSSTASSSEDASDPSCASSSSSSSSSDSSDEGAERGRAGPLRDCMNIPISVQTTLPQTPSRLPYKKIQPPPHPSRSLPGATSCASLERRTRPPATRATLAKARSASAWR